MSATENDIVIKEVNKSSEEIYNNIKGLLSQLTSSKILLSAKDLERIITSYSSILLAAYNKKIKIILLEF